MVIPSMDYKDIAKAFKTDFLAEVKKGYDNCFGQSEKLVSKVHKYNSNDFHLLYVHPKKTKQMNEFVVLFFSRDKPKKGKAIIRRTVYMKYHLSDGIHVATAHPNSIDEVTFYTPHFFERYRERGLKKTQIGINDTINHFLGITASTIINDVKNPKYPNSVYATNEEGVLLGENLGDGLFEFRTFISFEMLGNDQMLLSALQQEEGDEFKSNIEIINKELFNDFVRGSNF